MSSLGVGTVVLSFKLAEEADDEEVVVTTETTTVVVRTTTSSSSVSEVKPASN
jgi:hypothetical protein